MKILNEINFFVNGNLFAKKPVPPKDLTKSAINLINNIPFTKTAVLDYFSKLLENSLHFYVIKKDVGAFNELYEESFLNIRSCLITLIEENPKYWGDIISPWAIHLLGRICSLNGAHIWSINNIKPDFKNLPSLVKVISIWLELPPVSLLIDIIGECFSFSILNYPSHDYITTLMQANGQYAPHFEWALAHLGSCFPKTLINGILKLALSDFRKNLTNCEMSFDAYIPKLISLTRLFDYFISSRSLDMDSQFYQLFEEAIANPNDSSTLPFIISLAVFSDSISTIILTYLYPSVKANLQDVIQHMHRIFSSAVIWKWMSKDLLSSQIVKIIYCTQTNLSYDLLEYLINLTAYHDTHQQITTIKTEGHKTIREITKYIMDKLLVDIQFGVLAIPSTSHNTLGVAAPVIKIPFLESMKTPETLTDLCKDFLYFSEKQTQIFRLLKRFLVFFCVYTNDEFAIHVLSQIFILASDPGQLRLFSNMVDAIQCFGMDLLPPTIQKIWQTHDVARIIQNSITFLSTQELTPFIHRFTRLIIPQVLLGLDNFGGPIEYDCKSKAKLVGSCVPLLQICQNMHRLDRGDIAFNVKIVNTLPHIHHSWINERDVAKKCERGKEFVGLLRFLHKIHHGATLPSFLSTELITILLQPSPSAQMRGQDISSKFSLTKQNEEIGFGPTSLLRSVNNLNRKPKQTLLQHPHDYGERGSMNIQHYLNLDVLAGTIYPRESCNYQALYQYSRTIAEALNQSIYLDEDIPMDTSPQWYNFQQIKSNVERDLKIKNKLDQSPISWFLLTFIARSNAIMHSSLIVKSLMAYLIVHWESERSTHPTHTQTLYLLSLKTYQLLSLGKLLPQPFDQLHLVFGLISSYDIHLIFHTAWNYLHANPIDLPNKMGNVRPEYSIEQKTIIRSIFQKNIRSIGSLFKYFFPS